MKEIYSKEFIEKVEYAYSDLPGVVKLVREHDFMVGTDIDFFSRIQYRKFDVQEILECDDLEKLKEKALRIKARVAVAKEWDDKFGKQLLNLKYDIHDNDD